MRTFERLLRTEREDIGEIVDGIGRAQSDAVAARGGPVRRGSHTKGVCVTGTFEVFDLSKTVGDPVLRQRLAHGVFAHPGSYPATIRFANAVPEIQGDDIRDVRAITFAVALPAGVVEPDASRQDFSLNSATTFPMNDAHAFALFERIHRPTSKWSLITSLATLKAGEWASFFATVARAKLQQKRTPIRAYQQLRYFSCVPFRNGPNEAVKYSLTASPQNPAPDLGTLRKQDMLGDALRRAEPKTAPSVFDFGIQLLDADRMRRFWRKRDVIYWVENASAEWPERQAPFHTIARLVVNHERVVSDDENSSFYIDVTEHSCAASRPLGSLNRARWFAERASRLRRLGQTDESPSSLPQTESGGGNGAPLPPLPPPTLGRLTLGNIARAAVVVALAGAAGIGVMAVLMTWFIHTNRGILPPEHVDQVQYASAGWGRGLDAPDRQAFYYTPQGAGLRDLRYRWLVNLELPIGTRRLADPEIMRRFGFLVDPATPRNPDRLPVGFTRHFDSALHDDVLDITCAACHTGEIQRTVNGVTRAVRIDGGQADHALTMSTLPPTRADFITTMIASMAATMVNPLKFNRFATRVLRSPTFEGRWTLYRNMLAVSAGFLESGLHEKWHGLSPTDEGYGRTDALARIGNTVFGDNLTHDNDKIGNAPVSFPPLWNIWKFDWVQYNASVSQAMARNIGEAMGVGAKYTLVNEYGRPLPMNERFRSTALVDSLDFLEQKIRALAPPAWPVGVLGAVDAGKAAKGEQLFGRYCVGCHGPFVADAALTARNSPGKKDDQPEWILTTLCVDDIGTDPNAAVNFDTSRVDLSRTGLTADTLRTLARTNIESWIRRDSAYHASEIQRLQKFADKDSVAKRGQFEYDAREIRGREEQSLDHLDPKKMSTGEALSYLGTLVRLRAYDDGRYDTTRQAILDGFGTLDRPQILRAYKARPLAGMWATPPFLHNGSVPTVYDLLSPVDERPKTFQVGSREYDPVKLGLAPVKGFWTYDTHRDGNHNTGHEFARD
ncbi:MAG TPA: di-heme-cytochrome C peroxidase, partial [Gemmatimonadaceae bacterium]|nr:di-heme-cytochrome C peroxidase [Gemmatimonadaceae bacterium]